MKGDGPPVPHKKIFMVLSLVACLIFMLLQYDAAYLNSGFTDTTDQMNYSEDVKFLVDSSECKIMNLDPFNEEIREFYNPEEYETCTSLRLLTFVTKNNNTATLHIDNDVIPSYSNNTISCCYSNITRKVDENRPDDGIVISSCETFENNVTIYNDPVMVKCTEINNTGRNLYENVHVATLMKDEVKRKLDNFDNDAKPISVLFVGIDSISRLNFIRAMPRTFEFVEKNGWIPLKGYNKVEDNTFPNLMAIFTGYNLNQSEEICDPTTTGILDKCDMLWFDYRKLGYVTGYGEDEADINTFNYADKVGFTLPPADYYFRPYVIATEHLSNKTVKVFMTYCTGPETGGERLMNVAKDFAVTFKNTPNFGFFWMNSFSHQTLNSPSGMDSKVKTFLEDLTSTGVTDNSIIFFLSDHGMRFGDIRLTDTGWLEERLPFMYVSFPKRFQENYPEEYKNFKVNTRRLTSPYDLYMTLQHILVLSRLNYTVKASAGCPGCKSLFEEMDSERSCEEAGIDPHWCTCADYQNSTLKPASINAVSDYFLEQIHESIHSRISDYRCAYYSLDEILSISVYQRSSDDERTNLLVKMRTRPKAIFETTISYVGDIKNFDFSIRGGISRLDSYEGHDDCVDDAYLKKICYCRN